jgi:hypothetical protein
MSRVAGVCFATRAAKLYTSRVTLDQDNNPSQTSLPLRTKLSMQQCSQISTNGTVFVLRKMLY